MKRKKIRSAVAKNGKEAVDKWRQGGFHLVLMDIQLPVMSGLEATKEIRRLEHLNRVGAFSQKNSTPPAPEDTLDPKLFKSPVIIVALTASSLSADKSEALAAGCNDFLTKPVNLKWLEKKTIEWGCMQALIDFEGWKQWLPREDRSRASRSLLKLAGNSSSGRSRSRSSTGSRRQRSRPRSRSSSHAQNKLQRLTSTEHSPTVSTAH
jgi:osomolarity two-component system response regulator SSK1